MRERGLVADPKIEVRREGDGPKRLVGYAAVFNSLSEDLGGFREQIATGAFDNALAENPDVSVRVQHEGGITTVGRTTNGTLQLSTDAHGLFYEATPPDTQAGRDIMTLVSDGYIDKSSFAFSVREGGEVWNSEGEIPIRTLTDLDLYDVAPVDGPAYQDTTAEVRGMWQVKRDLWQLEKIVDEDESRKVIKRQREIERLSLDS